MVNVAAWSESIEMLTLPAAAGLTGSQYKCMKINTSGGVGLATSGGQVDGILYNKPTAAGEPAMIVIAGVAKVIAGAAVAYGAEVTSDSGGLVVTAANTTGAGGQQIVGRAVTSCTAANAVISILVGSHKALQSG